MTKWFLFYLYSYLFIFQDNNESQVLYSVPRELWLLIDHLYRHGLKTRELFDSTALREEMIRVRDWLDFGSLDVLRILFQHS